MEKDAVIDAVRDFAESEGYRYEFNAEREFLRLGFKVDCKLKHVDIIIAFHDIGYNVFAISPISADKDSASEMRKYLSMANYGLMNGNFEMNQNNGEIRYRCWVGTRNLESLPAEAVDEGVSVAYGMLKRYGNGIAAIALGFSNAETEIEKAEKPQDAGGQDG